MMATQENFSTYQRYKRDTTVFTTWLSNTAKGLGWRPSSKPSLNVQQAAATEKAATNAPANQKSVRLKGKARKAAKDAAQAPTNTAPVASQQPAVKLHPLTTKDLLDQVNLIAQSSQSKLSPMPERIWEALQGAIHARQRFCDWFEKMKLSTPEARDGHRHFVSVLTSALDVLPREPAFDKPAKTAKSTQESAHLDQDIAFMKNAFEVLELEDIRDEELVAVVDGAKPAAPGSESHVYQLETDRQSEAAFIIFSFFEDLHRVRNEVKKVWARYRDGQAHLLHATVVTAFALETVRQAENEASEAYGAAYQPTDKTYAAFMDVVYIANKLAPAARKTFSIGVSRLDETTGRMISEHQEEPKPFVQLDTSSLEITPMDEFMFLPAGRTLTKIAQMKEIIEKFSWPPPLPSMRTNYISRPELLEDIRYQLFERQDKFICQLAIDMMLDDQLRHPDTDAPAGIKSMASDLVLQWDDPLYSTLRQVWVEGHITTRMVWAAQIAFDISEACQGAPTGLQATTDAAKQIRESFGFHIDDGGALDTKDVRWLAKDQTNLLNIYQCVNMHMAQSVVSKFKTSLLEAGAADSQRLPVPPQRMALWEEQMRSTGWTPPTQEHKDTALRIGADKMIHYNEDPKFLVNANILYSGTLLLDVASMVEDAGVSLANHHLSIFGIAHLYNALMQLGICEIHWPEMDRIIELHQNAIFADDIPTKPHDMVARFAYRTGITATNSRRFNAKQPWKFQTTAAAQTLRKFFTANESLPRVLTSLSTQAETHQLSPYTIGKQAPGTGKSPARRVTNQLELTPRQAVKRLEKYIEAVLPDMQIDYVSMTRQCNAFLRKVRTQIARETGVHYPVINEPGDSNDHGLLLVVFGILEELKAALAETGRKGKKRRGQDETPDGHVKAMLEMAPQAQIASKFLQTEFGLGG